MGGRGLCNVGDYGRYRNTEGRDCGSRDYGR